ncbi:MAG: hypothetical protein ABIW03_06225, partial [Sphingomicrobium sp.]
GLAGNAARFELQRLAAEIDFDSFHIEHVVSFARAPDAAEFINARASRPAAVRGIEMAPWTLRRIAEVP